MSQLRNSSLLAATVGLILAITLSQFLDAAQKPTNAAQKARARMKERHSRTGSVGNGYRPWSAWTYQQSARAHARTLNTYGRNSQELPAATANEHIKEIQRNVAATRTEVGKLGEEAASQAEVKEHVEALEKHLAECERLCGMMEKTISTDHVDGPAMCKHCDSLESALKAAEMEHQKLLKELGIEPPVADHEHHKESNEKGGTTK